MKTILITGGCGFIGSNLINALIQNNKIICVDNLATGSLENIKIYLENPNFKFINHDVIDYLEIADQKIDEVFHLACPASPPQYQKDPIFTFKTSVWGTYNMLELAKKHDAKILISSTSEVYGDPNISPQKENYWGNVNPIGIRSCYDEGKRGAETLAMDFYRQHNVRLKIIRIFNTYGPHMDPNDGRVVSNFINQALKDEDITIYGEGKQTRSFQYIDDLINGMLKTMATGDDFIGPVNLGNPNEFSIYELAKKVIEQIPTTKSKIVYKPLPQDDPKQRKPDISLAKNILGWEPTIQLAEGLQFTIKYFNSLL